MPNFYDQATRFLVKLDAIEFLNWALGLASTQYQFDRWIDTRSVPFPGEKDRTSDLVAHLENRESGGVPWLVPIEFQITPDTLMFGRLMVYLGNLWLSFKPDSERGSRYALGAILVNLTGATRCSQSMDWPSAKLRTELRIAEINLQQFDAHTIFAQIESNNQGVHLLPWISLMQGGDSDDIIARWKRIAETITNERRRNELAALTVIFAEAVNREQLWKSAFKGWNMKEPSVVLEWMEESRKSGKVAQWIEESKVQTSREHIQTILLDRFGSFSPELNQRIEKQSDLKLLSQWLTLAVRCDSLEAFQQAIIQGNS